MSLKSLVNKSIVKSDLRRFWYIGVLFFGALLLSVTVPVVDAMNFRMDFDSNSFWSFANIGVLVVMLFGILTPVILFSYLHKKSAVCAAHSLPLKRECVFFSHIVSSAVLLFVPIILNALVLLSLDKLYAPDILLWVALSVVYCILFGGLGLLSSSISGNTFAAMAIPFVVILLPQFSATLFEALADEYLFGFSFNNAVTLSSRVADWYIPYSTLRGASIAIYVALGVVFGAIGFVCYKKRALENNSSVVAFKGLNPVFVYGVAIYGGLLGMLYIAAITDIFSIWLAVPFGIAGIIIARMLVLKSFRPQNVIKPSIIYIAVMAVLYAFIGLDITGYETRVPDIDKIASVDVSDNGVDYSDRLYYEDGIEYAIAPEAYYKTALTDKADIEKVVLMHKSIVANVRRGDHNNTRNNNYIPIVYKLTNGKVIARKYWYTATREQKELYFDIEDIPTVKAYKYPVLSDAERSYISGRVDTCGFKSMAFSEEQIEKLRGALREDISKMSVRDMQGEPITKIMLHVELPVVDDKGNRVQKPIYHSQVDEEYYVREGYEKTTALLREWGMYKVMPTAEDVECIRTYPVSEGKDIAGGEEITDKARIQKYLDYLADTYDIPNHEKNEININIHYTSGAVWGIALPEPVA